MNASWTRILGFGVALALAWPGIALIRETAERAQWFHLTPDETVHVELIEVLAQTGRYANWNGNPFPPRLTSGPALTLPAAALLKVTGWSGAVSGRAISYLYFIATLLLILRLRKRHLSQSLFALGIFMLHWRALQDTHYYPFAVLGESALIFYTLLCMRTYASGHYLSSGVAAALAVLAKPYILPLPAVLFLFTLFQPGKRKAALGIALTATVVLAAMITQTDTHTVFQYILNYPSAMREANGAGLADSFEWFKKWEGLQGTLTWMGLLLLGAGLTRAIKTLATREAEWMPFLIFAFLHLGWWWFLSPGTQARYLIPSYLVLTYLNLATLDRFWLRQLPRAPAWIAGLVVLGIGASTLERIHKSWSHHAGNYDECGFCFQLEAQKYWRSLPSPRPNLYSYSNGGYAQDLDLVVTAPSHITLLQDLDQAPKTPMNWVALGEFTVENAAQKLKQRGCTPVKTWGLNQKGFWDCAQH